MIFLQTCDLLDTKSFPFSRSKISHNFFISDATPDEVMNMIKILPNKTSAGHDNISYMVCKTSGPVLAKPLADNFKQCIKEDIFPTW